MMLLDRVQSFIEAHRLMDPGALVGVGVSGGLDSTVLLHVLHRLDFLLVALHVNYGLRGGASDGDEAFVRAFCETLGVPLRATCVDAKAYAQEHDPSVQEAARDLRYHFFADVASEEALPAVAVAHHRDDQAETLLLNLFRGSGPEGLAGMPAARALSPDGSAQLVRPLLEVPRADLERYARAHDLSWREDESNADLAYRRNAVRHRVLPCIEEHMGAAASDNIARAASLMRGYLEAEWQPELDERFAACAEEDAKGGFLKLDALREAPSVWRGRLILEALRRWLPQAPQHAAVAGAIGDLLASQPGRRVELGAGTVWRERGRLTFQPTQRVDAEAPSAGALAMGETLRLAAGTLRAETIAERPDDLRTGGPSVAYVDAERLRFPLQVRPWQDGDRFQPLGMTHTKNVSDFLTDEKVPPSERGAVLVACARDGAIVWVVGHRLAHPVRVRPATDRLAKLTFRLASD